MDPRLLALAAFLWLPLVGARAAEPSAARDRLVIGLSLPGLYHPVFDTGLRGARRAARALGVELAVKNAGWNAQQQARDVDELVARHVDGIVVWPLPELVGSPVPSVEAALAAGIPVAAVEASPGTDRELVLVTSDHSDEGRQAARLMVERLHGRGVVLELDASGFAPEVMRSLEETLSSSGIRVLARREAFMRQHYARFAMAALIREHPRFDGVVALNDDMMLGAIDAMREAGIKPSTKVLVSLGYIPEASRLIEAGDLSATFDPRFDLHTGRAVEILVKYLRTMAMPEEKIIRIRGALGVLACAPELTTVRARSIDSKSGCRPDWTPQRRYAFIAFCAGAPPVPLKDPRETQEWCVCYQAEVEHRHSWAWVTDGVLVGAEDDEAEDLASQGACLDKLAGSAVRP